MLAPVVQTSSSFANIIFQMKTLDSRRREFLKLSPFALAATVPAFGAPAKPPTPSAGQGIFDVRTFGALGDGKTVDTPAINKAIEAAAAAGGGTVRLSRRQLHVLLHPPEEQCRPLSLRRAPLSRPPRHPCPDRPPATTAAPTIPPSPRPPTTRIRTTATTTGTTR